MVSSAVFVSLEQAEILLIVHLYWFLFGFALELIRKISK